MTQDRRPLDPFEERLLEHYSGVGVRMGWGRVRFQSRRIVFLLVARGTWWCKRVLDVVLGALAIVALSPLLATVALLVKLDSPGPVFFAQVRVGRRGRTFRMFKFRSMYTDAEERKRKLMAENEMAGGVTFKMKADPRITRVGRFLRKASIDELPQLLNVVRGEMSLVGPRPPVPGEVAEYSVADRRRLEVVPGITCIWQVSGRSDIPFDQQVELDARYIESRSFLGDCKLLLATIPAVLLGRGAY